MAEILPPEDNIAQIVDLKKALEERYLSYALSTITQRALPDVRDGLKPVHRRILYVMHLLKLVPTQKYKKSAKVVGDVIGGFHPHGDQSIYDALVRLAQDFALRFPLVDGQGNFGSIDGDSAAAYRYTEARMTDVAARLLEGIGEDAVDFVPTYDGETSQPSVLPANFPNLLANGSSGIAVGMATSIPPHNVGELCEAALHLIHNPEATTAELMKFVPGPDFPTGGILVEPKEEIAKAYETGRGGFRLRARWEQEDAGRGTYQIVVTQMSYGVQKSKLVEKIADLLLAKKLPLLKDVRDESAEDVRLILEPKSRSVDPIVLMESLYKLTDLETRFSLNMNVLDGGLVPKVMGLGDVLRAWLQHRKQVLIRRSQYRLNQIEKRLEMLSGYLIAFLNLDEVIRIIREEDHPKAELMSRFSLTDGQAEAILNMRLRSLRKLEEVEIRSEHVKLTDEKGHIEVLLGSERRQWGAITTQVSELKELYGPKTEIGARRTSFESMPDSEDFDFDAAMIEREPVTIVLSEKGWVRALKGHNIEQSSLQFKTGDAFKLAIKVQTTDKILMLTTDGRIYTLGADKLPGGRGHGEPVRIMVDMEEGHDIVDMFMHVPGTKRLIVSNLGNGFVVLEDDMIANTRKGKKILNVSEPNEAVLCVVADGDQVAVIGQNRKLLIFPFSQLPQMGRGKGMRLQKYKDGGISDVSVFHAEQGMTWLDSSGRTFTRSMDELLEWIGERAGAGRIRPTGFPRNNRFKG